jgi:hypothetical protein
MYVVATSLPSLVPAKFEFAVILVEGVPYYRKTYDLYGTDSTFTSPVDLFIFFFAFTESPLFADTSKGGGEIWCGSSDYPCNS